ncbi:MAG: hypothetical protein MJZ16_09465 [Bacteroidales bacterium]|nr:hypothetical protein [Bacteroidales bacterium]
MKKYILSLIVLTISVVSFAKSPIRVVSGSPSVVKGKTVFVEFDNKDAVIVDEDTKKSMTIEEFCQMKGGEWVQDMGKDDVEALEEINETLSNKAKSFNVTYNKSTADYILVVRTDTFSYGNPLAFGAAFLPKDALGFFIGKFIIKTPSGETVCELACEKVNADGITYTWTKQKRRIYMLATKELASVLNKGK